MENEKPQPERVFRNKLKDERLRKARKKMSSGVCGPSHDARQNELIQERRMLQRNPKAKVPQRSRHTGSYYG